jgi:hypothetical protein
MNKYFKSLLVIFSFLCLGCFQQEKNYVAKVKLLKLHEADIYNADVVYDVIFDSEEQNVDSLRNLSQQLFLKGIDTYKNKKNVIDAIVLFKESILTFPNAKTYYELGNAKLEANQGDPGLKDAQAAYYVAEKLNFQPLSMIYYKKACVSNLLHEVDESNVRAYLYQAFQAGFSDTTLLNNDKYLKSFLTTKAYRNLMADVELKKLLAHPENLFDTFKKSFAVVSLPFEITFDQVGMKDYKQSISYDFAKFVPEMQTSSFGREASHDFLYVAKVAETPNYTALLYSSVNYYGENMQPVHTKLVTYNNEGDIIASILFSGQFTANNIKIGQIEGNRISLQDYKRVWKKPIDEVPFDENAVEKYELISSAVFQIDDSGKIMEESVPANYKDSVVFAKN